MTPIPEDADLSRRVPRLPGPPARPTLRLRWGLLIELDHFGELVIVWEPDAADVAMGINLVMAVEEFKSQLGAMYLAWGR